MESTVMPLSQPPLPWPFCVPTSQVYGGNSRAAGSWKLSACSSEWSHRPGPSSTSELDTPVLPNSGSAVSLRTRGVSECESVLPFSFPSWHSFFHLVPPCLCPSMPFSKPFLSLPLSLGVRESKFQMLSLPFTSCVILFCFVLFYQLCDFW